MCQESGSAGWSQELLSENREIIDRINLRIGYRLGPIAIQER